MNELDRIRHSTAHIMAAAICRLYDNVKLDIKLSSRVEQLNEVVVRANKKKIFQIRRMKDFEETSVFAGKKNEVILLELSMANLASNNARQIYNQIPGLNIYQNDDAGLQ